MGRKTIVLSIIVGVIVLSCIGKFIYDKKTDNDNVVNGENNETQIEETMQQENIIQPEDNIEKIETEKANEDIDKEQLEEIKPAIEKTTKDIEKNSSNISTKKENTKNDTSKSNSTQNKTQDKVPSQTSTNKQESKPVVKEEQTTTSKENNNSYTEQEVQIAPVTECVGNNHKIGAGNSGKWFNTQAEAGEYFKTEIKKWGDKWESFEIEDDEYYKNCPYGYEVWTCPQCQKWTINFYYNK